MRNNVWVQNDILKASASGNVLYIGNTADNRVASVVGNFDDDTGTGVNGLVTVSNLHLYDPATDRWVRARSSAMISGVHKLLASVSGDIVGAVIQNAAGVTAQVAQVDNDLISSMTGFAPNALVTANMLYAVHDPTGSWVRLRATKTPISGEHKLMVTISGDTVHDMGTQIVTAPLQACSAVSGGTQMPNQPCIECTVQNLSGNSPAYVGGNSTQAPYSGKGQVLYGGQSRTYRVDNFNKIQVFAVKANDMVSIDGYL